MTIRVVLADDHQIVRTGLRELLEKQSDVKVVGEARNGEEAIKLVREIKPDVVIMDIAMPDMNGIEATYQLLAANKNLKIIALSMYSDRRFVRGMLKAGACGYLLKDCALEDLVTGIRSAISNRMYMSPQISDAVVKDHIQQLKKTDLSAYAFLTNREVEVLQLLSEGKTTREIAAKLSLSVKTIETHRQQLMEKLGIYTVAGLTKYSIKEGITSLEL